MTAVKHTDTPTKSLKLLATAIEGFLARPESAEAFSGLDWFLRVAVAKWEAYALQRRVDAQQIRDKQGI